MVFAAIFGARSVLLSEKADILFDALDDALLRKPYIRILTKILHHDQLLKIRQMRDRRHYL